jgi:TonB family protein
MRTANSVLSLAMLLSPFAGSAQNTAPRSPAQQDVPTRNPHSTKADLEVPMCPTKFHDSLKTNGIVSSGEEGVTPPKVVYSAFFGPTDESRKMAQQTKNKRNPPSCDGCVIISVVVDEHGYPYNVCLEKSSGYGLDANAANAVSRDKFDPAIKDGKPVPSRIRVELSWTLF